MSVGPHLALRLQNPTYVMLDVIKLLKTNQKALKKDMRAQHVYKGEANNHGYCLYQSKINIQDMTGEGRNWKTAKKLRRNQTAEPEKEKTKAPKKETTQHQGWRNHTFIT